MAVTIGTTLPSTTPSTSFYTNVLSPALLAASWVLVESVVAATAGTTADVYVWRTPATDFYLIIEPDNTNTRIRFRASESYNAATHKTIRPVHGGDAEIAYTPAADYSVPGGGGSAEFTIHTATTTGICQVSMYPGGGGYLLEVRPKVFTLAVKSGGTMYHVVIGHFTSLVDTVTDSQPLFMHVNPNSKVWTADTNNTRIKDTSTSREPNTTTSLAGAFSYILGDPMDGTTASAGAAETGAWGTLEGGVQHYFYNGFIASPAVLHGTTSSGATAPSRSLRGYIPDFVIVRGAAVGGVTFSPAMGTLFKVGGVNYYIVGQCRSVERIGGRAYLGIKA